MYRYTRVPIQDIDFKIQETLDVALTEPGAFAYNIYMIQTPPRLSTMRTMVGSLFLYKDVNFMKDLKKHLSLTEQVALMVSRGLIVADTSEAQNLLFHVNYYRLSGYLHGFKQPDGVNYIPQTTLAQIQTLYDFDRKFTRILMFAMEDIEETFKTRLSYALTSAFPDDPLIYLNPEIYRDKEDFERFKRHFQEEFKNNKKLPFIKHHIQEYDGQLPMWVAVEILTMGNLSALYRNLLPKYQKKLAHYYYTGPEQLENWIKNLTYTRNHLAHYMRIYDFNFGRSPKQCSHHHLYKKASNRIFDQIYIMSFMYSTPSEWNNYVLPEISALLENYSEYVHLPALGFPDNWQEILTIRQ